MPEPKPMTTTQLTKAVQRLVEREEAREAERADAARAAAVARQHALEERQLQIARSVEVFKWCLLGIVATFVLAFGVGGAITLELEREATRSKAEVEEIRAEAEEIRDRIRSEAQAIRERLTHPMTSLLGMLGGQLDSAFARALMDRKESGEGD